MQRIGVFVCHCGTNIAATVDVKKVVDVISKEPGVVHAGQQLCAPKMDFPGTAAVLSNIKAAVPYAPPPFFIRVWDYPNKQF